MLDARQVHREVPELRSGYDEATAFADFCRYLGGAAVESEARALTEAPVLIVTTHRTDELTRRHPLRPFLAEVGRLPGAHWVDLPNLDRDQVAVIFAEQGPE